MNALEHLEHILYLLDTISIKLDDQEQFSTCAENSDLKMDLKKLQILEDEDSPIKVTQKKNTLSRVTPSRRVQDDSSDDENSGVSNLLSTLNTKFHGNSSDEEDACYHEDVYDDYSYNTDEESNASEHHSIYDDENDDISVYNFPRSTNEHILPLHAEFQHPSAPSTPRRSAKNTPSKTTAFRAFVSTRESSAIRMMSEFDKTVFYGQLGVIPIEWYSRLQSTAGQAVLKATNKTNRTAVIKLSSKVIDTEEKLQTTLAHEQCHVAAWVIDGVAKPPHGQAFKRYANKVMQIYPHLSIATCHNYDIYFKHRYQCACCEHIFGRHSKSMKTDQWRCKCGGMLSYVGAFDRDGTPAKQRTPSKYNAYVKSHMSQQKQKQPHLTPKELMSQLAKDYHLHHAVSLEDNTSSNKENDFDELCSSLHRTLVFD